MIKALVRIKCIFKKFLPSGRLDGGFILCLLPLSLFAQEDATMVSANGDTLVIDTLANADECNVPFVQSDSLQPTFDYRNTYYWNRSRVKKFTGTSCLVVGGCSFCLYALIRGLFWDSGDDKKFETFDLFGCGSAALMATSIPLYISASKDKKKALNMTFEEYQADRHRKDYHRNGMRYQLGFFLNTPLDNYGGDPELGCGISFEGMTYLGSSNFDLALNFTYEHISYNDSQLHYYYDYYDPYYDEEDYEECEPSCRLTCYGDYNFCKNQVANPFVGVGVGVGMPAYVFVAPRVGVELFNHLRLTAGAHINVVADKNHSWYCNDGYIQLGYTF